MQLLKIKLVLIIAAFQIVSAGYFDGDSYDDSSDFYKNLEEKDDYNYDDSNDFYRKLDEQDDNNYGSSDDFYYEDDSGSGSNKNTSEGNCNKCGIVYRGHLDSGRVINGKPVKPLYKYPWTVSLIFKNKIKCGGALISETAVLTAAHCVFSKHKARSTPECKGEEASQSCFFPPDAINVGLLSAKQQTPSHSVSVAVRKIIPHPKYSFSQQIYDVAILQLAKPVKCGTYTSPVCLPAKLDLKLGTTLIFAGYGRNTSEGTQGPPELREGSMKVINPQRCVRSKQPRNTARTIICASGSQSNQKACFGDSGSALFGKFRNKMYAVGLVSRGRGGNCNIQTPVTFTKTQAALPFIKRNVRDLPQVTGEGPSSKPRDNY